MAQRGEGVEEKRRQRRQTHANQTWRAFVSDLAATAHLDDDDATNAAISVLCHLQERLTGDEARDLASQLPVKLRELLGDVCGPADVIVKFHKDEFVATVARDLGIQDPEAEVCIRAVFATVRNRISEGEADDVAAQLPEDMRALWMQAS
jgi:uncharacterized protein (DUF2267 family)